MSTLEDLDALEHQDKKEGEDQDPKKPNQTGDADMKDADGDNKDAEEEEEVLDADILNSSTRDIVTRRRLLENDTRIMRSEFQRLTHEKQAMLEKIKDNVDKIDNNRCAAPDCLSPTTCPLYLSSTLSLISPNPIPLLPADMTQTANSHTSSATLSRSSIWTSKKMLPKRAPTSI